MRRGFGWEGSDEGAGDKACLGIIEVNSACDMACPLYFAEAGPGFSLTLEEVEDKQITDNKPGKGPRAVPPAFGNDPMGGANPPVSIAR